MDKSLLKKHFYFLFCFIVFFNTQAQIYRELIRIKVKDKC